MDEALAVLVRAKYPALRRAAYVLTGDVHAADDLVQAGLLKVLRSTGRLKAAESADAYLYAVLVNTYRTSRRRRWRGEIPFAAPPEAGRAEGPDADAGVLVRQPLLEALATLSPQQRQVLVLRFMADLSEPQTAEALGCPVGTVKSRTARALEVLRRDPRLRGLLGDVEVAT